MPVTAPCVAAVIVDALTEPQLRRDLTVKSLLHNRDLWGLITKQGVAVV
jgi:hypothetical protein